MTQKLMAYRDHLLTHGQGSYRSWNLTRGRYGNGVRVSLGGYGWHWHRPTVYGDGTVFSLFGGFIRFSDYYINAAHLSFGPLTFSLVYSGTGLARAQILAVRLGEYIADQAHGPHCVTCQRRTFDGQCAKCVAFLAEDDIADEADGFSADYGPVAGDY